MYTIKSTHLPSLMQVMIPLHCEDGKDNEYEKYAVTIIYNSFHLNKLVGHVLFCQNVLADKFLKFSNHNICVVVTGKRVNRGIDLGVETPADYFFHEENRVIEWFRKSMETIMLSNSLISSQGNLTNALLLKWKNARNNL